MASLSVQRSVDATRRVSHRHRLPEWAIAVRPHVSHWRPRAGVGGLGDAFGSTFPARIDDTLRNWPLPYRHACRSGGYDGRRTSRQRANPLAELQTLAARRRATPPRYASASVCMRRPPDRSKLAKSPLTIGTHQLNNQIVKERRSTFSAAYHLAALTKPACRTWTT